MEIVGDFTTTVRKALEEIDPKYESYSGLIVCGKHAPQASVADEEIALIKIARETQLPTLGICWGLQAMMIEYARDVFKIRGATSEEIDPDSASAIIVKMPELRVGIKDVAGRLESHWHNYRVQEISAMESAFHIIRTDEIMEQARLRDHRFFVGVQYHPEYQSSKDAPHPLLVDFLRICSAV